MSTVQRRISRVDELTLVQYSNFTLDQNARFTVADYSTCVRGVPRAITTHATTVRTENVKAA